MDDMIDRIDDVRRDAGDAPEVPRLLGEAMREFIAANPNASRADLDKALQGALHTYNTRPQAELCGLSPLAAHRLLSAEWDTPGGAVETRTDLSLQELAGAPFLANARIFLAALAEAETRATQAGNLNRAFVERMLHSMRFPSELVELIMEVNKVVNEQDARPLHVLRVVLVQAGLVKTRKDAFSLTRHGEDLRSEDAAGALFARLFHTYFRRFNLAYGDRYPEAPELQHTLAVSLYRFGEVGDWFSPRRAVAEIVLPVVRQRVPPGPERHDLLPGLVEHRFLERLVDFGLAETRNARNERERTEFPEWAAALPGGLRLYRKTPLFDRFLTFRPTV